MSEHIGSNGQEPYGNALAAKEDFLVALFSSVSHVLAAERRLKKAPVPHKLIPVPKKNQQQLRHLHPFSAGA